MTFPTAGAIIRTNYNPPSIRYRVIQTWIAPDGSASFVCHLADDPSGKHGKYYVNNFRLVGARILGTCYAPGTAGWQAIYGEAHLHNPEAGDGYAEVLLELHEEQMTLFAGDRASGGSRIGGGAR